MEINNIEIIKQFINSIDKNDFWFIQILRRKKENPDNTSNNQLIKTYYINSFEHLQSKFDEMKLLSKFHNARVYINLNRCNYEQLGLQMIKKVSDCLINKSYSDIKNAYNSVCGSINCEKDKKWIVDIDCKEVSKVDEYLNIITTMHKFYNIEFSVSPVYIRTMNGYHLIISPFDTKLFEEMCKNNGLIIPDIHKNNPTLLYYSDEKISL